MSQQELQFREDESQLRINGALNYEIYRNLPKDALKEFVKNDAERLAKNFVSREWTSEVQIECLYVIIDHLYNRRGFVEASTTYTHETGCSEIKLSKHHGHG